MRNQSIPTTINELVEVLQAGFDEENLDPSKLTRKELAAELSSRGIDIQPALGRVHAQLDKLRGDSAAKSVSPVEALYQRCRRSIPTKPLRDNILGLLRSLKQDHVRQAEAYAATIDLHDQADVEQFRQNLAKLNGLPTQRQKS